MGPGSLVGADLQYSLQSSTPRSRLYRWRTASRRYHIVKGVRVRSKIVPAVTELRVEHAGHMKRPSPKRQPPSWPQLGTDEAVRATAAIRGSPGSPHRFETRLETRQPSPGSACQREDTPCTEHMVTPVKMDTPNVGLFVYFLFREEIPDVRMLLKEVQRDAITESLADPVGDNLSVWQRHQENVSDWSIL